MSTRPRWIAGDDRLRETIEAAIVGGAGCEIVHATARRRVLRLRIPHDGALALKHFRDRPSRRITAGWKRALGHSAAAREWRALDELARRNLPAPLPRAHLLHGRDEWLAMDYVAGRPLSELLRSCAPADRRACIEQLGLLLRQLRIEGIAHGDLHLGNILLTEDAAPVLIDWQRSALTRSARAHDRDLASLEFSLARSGVGRADRLRLRQAALGTASSRRALLAAGKRADAFASDHFRGRTRRCRTPGSGQTRISPLLGNGMRLRELDDETVAAALAAHDATLAQGGANVLKHDERARVTRLQVGGRAIIVKEVVKGGLGRRLADPLRGSPAQRGWVAGHGLRARGIGTAQPLAWIDVAATPARSLLLLSDVSEQPCWASARPGELNVDAALRLLLALHRRGVDHGDLQASHLFGFDVPVLIDLEGVRFRARLRDEARLRALAELNASLDESVLSTAQRCSVFARYAHALPFSMPAQRALREVVRRSIARDHVWQGRDCSLEEEVRSLAR